MKKVLTFLLLTMSIQLFSANYKVVLKKGVTFSQQEVNKNNKEIEIAARRDFDLIMNTTMQGTNSMVSGIINGKMPLSSSNKNIEKKDEIILQRLI